MNTLDQFSDYLEGAEQEMLKEETEGEFGGLGIQIINLALKFIDTFA